MNHSPQTQSKLKDQLQESEGKLSAMQEELQALRQENRHLRENDRKSRAWLEHSPVCTKVLDLDFNLKYMSHAGVGALKLEDAESYYCKPYPIHWFPEHFRSTMLRSLEHVRETGEVAYQEAPLIALDGQEMWFRSTIVPVFDEGGEIEYLLVVSVDITDRLRAEEHRVELERQIQHAQKLESLGVLSGGIAHDFNNLLMSVLGNTDLALDHIPEGHVAHRNLLEVEKAARRGAELAGQMLAYSGRGKFVIEPIHLGSFLAEMAHLLDVTLSKKAVLKIDFPADLPTFDGDPTQVRQVIMNLITNASEALGEQGGNIQLTAGVQDCNRAFLDTFQEPFQQGADAPLEEGRYVYFKVTDDGCGMDQETCNKVFEPFFTTKFTGRGLGMSAVLGIVRGHHGMMKVQSAPKQGSSFQVFFPISAATAEANLAPPSGTPQNHDWRGSGTILIADDEAAVCAVGQEMLKHFGFKVLQAADGREAIDVYLQNSETIDCILLDLTMPEFDGEQVFRELRRIHPDVKVILTSGYNIQDVSKRFFGEGLSGFLQKPFDLNSLRDVLARVLPSSD
ncbi:MAG: hybrid sensor histidine kinase/response regulator [Planctomycetota bacterium]